QFLLGHLSMLDLYRRRTGEALRLADLALAAEPVGRSAAMFHLRRGRALAELGADGEGLREMRRARALLGGSAAGGPMDWSWWLHDAEMTLHEALVESAVGRHARAVDLVQRAVAGLPARQGRDRVVYRAYALGVLVAAGAWVDAQRVSVELVAARVV